MGVKCKRNARTRKVKGPPERQEIIFPFQQELETRQRRREEVGQKERERGRMGKKVNLLSCGQECELVSARLQLAGSAE